MQQIGKQYLKNLYGSIQNLRMIFQIFEKIKSRIPHDLFAKKLRQKSQQFKAQMKSKNYKIPQRFDQIICSMVQMNFDVQDKMRKSRKTVKSYFRRQFKDIKQLQQVKQQSQSEQQSTKVQKKQKIIRKKNVHRRRIIKATKMMKKANMKKKRKPAKTKDSQIYEQPSSEENNDYQT